jgi:hypothetical protein
MTAMKYLRLCAAPITFLLSCVAQICAYMGGAVWPVWALFAIFLVALVITARELQALFALEGVVDRQCETATPKEVAEFLDFATASGKGQEAKDFLEKVKVQHGVIRMGHLLLASQVVRGLEVKSVPAFIKGNRAVRGA